MIRRWRWFDVSDQYADMLDSQNVVRVVRLEHEGGGYQIDVMTDGPWKSLGRRDQASVLRRARNTIRSSVLAGDTLRGLRFGVARCDDE